MTSPPALGANAAVENLLDDRLRALEAAFDADAIAIYGPIEVGSDDIVRMAVEARRAGGGDRNHLMVLLDTEGGYIEVVSRMVDTIRHHYELVSFVIPNNAYSAGTVLAMSGDSIYMDYYSRLGPIDPQARGTNGEMLPALGYLTRYEQLIKKSHTNGGHGLSIGEMQVLINTDQAALYKYDQARQLSVTLLRDWLCKYKFKDWVVTETRGLPVTVRMKRNRAVQIAKQLSNTDRWHAHGHGISAEVLKNELKLRIDDFGTRKDVIGQYHDLMSDYMAKLGVGAVHCVGHFLPYHVHVH